MDFLLLKACKVVVFFPTNGRKGKGPFEGQSLRQGN